MADDGRVRTDQGPPASGTVSPSSVIHPPPSGILSAHLELPAATADLRKLTIGAVVYLTGRVFTARERVYQHAIEDGAGMPAGKEALGAVNFHCSPAATVKPDGTYVVSAVTATASFRFTKWLSDWFRISGCNIIIGKGGMTSQIYRAQFVPNAAIYLTTVGYGTGALLGRGIRRVADVHWLKELGIAQAVWVLDVEKFGPFIVESDLEGNSLFERENAKIAPGLDKLYEGTRPATMRRFGETDDKAQEVI
jgi:L(+)-tartrate dehydratase beta subunit